MAEKFNLIELVNNSGCFDLQFRKDTRHERTGSPTYYRWKVQFIVTAPKDNIAVLEKAEKELGCGKVTVTGTQARLSVQNIEEICEMVIPYFKKMWNGSSPSHKASANQSKKKDFDSWQKAAAIVWKNKGKKISTWEKSDLSSLVELHKLSIQHKGNTKSAKWIEMAKTLTKKTA